MRKLVWVVLAGVALFVFAGRRFGGGVVSANSIGAHATTVAPAAAPRGRTLLVRVLSMPSLSVKVSWDTICSRNLSPTTASGQFTGRAPLRRGIRSPLPRVKGCIVSAMATLRSSGTLVVEILAH